MTLSMTIFTGLSPTVALTIGASGVESVPTKSVLASTNSRSPGRFLLYLMRASWMMSPIRTFDGQATSQRLQLRKYLSASS